MTITAQGGAFSYGTQSAKETVATTWYRHKALAAAMGAFVNKEVAPPEIGGSHNPTGAFKTMAGYTGRVSMLPRLEGDIGYLLRGAIGAADAPVVLPSTANQHVFHQATAANGGAGSLPWMSFRRHIPGESTANDLGDLGIDCKISTMSFTIPQSGPVRLDMDIQGRTPEFDEAPDVWTYVDNFEEFESVPMSMKGTFRMPSYFGGNPIPATGARISIINGLTSYQEEAVVGSYFADDFATRQRIFQIEFTYKYRDPELCRLIFNNSHLDDTINTFDPCIEYTDFEAIVESPCDIDPGTIDQPWRLTFKAGKVDWREAGPIVLSGDDIIQQNYIGIAIEDTPGSPETYFTVELENEVAVQYT